MLVSKTQPALEPDDQDDDDDFDSIIEMPEPSEANSCKGKRRSLSILEELNFETKVPSCKLPNKRQRRANPRFAEDYMDSLARLGSLSAEDAYRSERSIQSSLPPQGTRTS